MRIKLTILSLLIIFSALHVFSQDYFPQFLDVIDENVYAVATHDLDGDLDLDILLSYTVEINNPFAPDRIEGRIRWYENLGYGFLQRDTLASFGEFWATSIQMADLDGDNDEDMLYTLFNYDLLLERNKVAWKKNVGNLEFQDGGEFTDADEHFMFRPRATPTDMDGDGDTDILLAYHDQSYPEADSNLIEWYANDGEGLFPDRHIVYVQSFGTLFGLSYFIHSADLNNDLSPDILTYDENLDQVVHYLNNGDGTFAAAVPTPIHPNNSQMESADLNGDGFLDIIIRTNDNETVWYAGDGAGSFGSENVLINAPLRALHAADLDGDMDIDLTAIRSGSDLEWYENDGGGQFTAHNIAGMFASGIATADFDHDGVMEIVPAGKFDGAFQYFGNPDLSANVISGTVFYDLDQDGEFDDGEPGLIDATVSVSPGGILVFSLEDGQYVFTGDTAISYVVSVDTLPGWRLTSDSASYQINLPLDSATTFDFGLYPDSFYHDIDLDIGSLHARCGEELLIDLRVVNRGTIRESGVVQFSPGQQISITGTSPDTDTIAGDTAKWNFSGLWPGEVAVYRLTTQLPGVGSIGDTLVFEADVFVEDSMGVVEGMFSTEYSTILVCSYDPNDKQAWPYGQGNDNQVANGTEFTYTIRFQNTGNATAYDVTTIDTLDDRLDLSSLRILNKSHYMTTTVDQVHRIVRFDFPSINLPDSTSSPELSQGYVRFSIKPDGFFDGPVIITNTAYIYFDNNPAIMTNTVFHTIFDGNVPTILPEHENGVIVNFFPNPLHTRSVVTVESELTSSYIFEIYDAKGAFVRQSIPKNSDHWVVERGALGTGMYFLLVRNSHGVIVAGHRFLIQ